MSGGHELHYQSLHEDHLSTHTYSFSDIPFEKISSLCVRIKEGPSSALLIIPDYKADTFQCARLSTIPDLPSGYIRFMNGSPVAFIPIQSEIEDSLLYRLDLSADYFTRPESAFYLVTIPPSHAPDYIASSLWIEFEDGHRLSIRVSPKIPLWLNIVLGMGLGSILLLVDHRMIEQHGNWWVRHRIQRRIILWRLFGLAYSAIFILTRIGIVTTPKTPEYYLYLLFCF